MTDIVEIDTVESDLIENGSPDKKPRSKKRQRTKLIGVHCTPEEYAKIEEKAAAAGLSVSGYARNKLLGKKTRRTQRRILPEAAVLAPLVGQLGSLGNNLNQLAHMGHMDRAINQDYLNDILGRIDDLAADIRGVFR